MENWKKQRTLIFPTPKIIGISKLIKAWCLNSFDKFSSLILSYNFKVDFILEFICISKIAAK
jgi:hypothetical protein